jgi:hypothetical protein
MSTTIIRNDRTTIHLVSKDIELISPIINSFQQLDIENHGNYLIITGLDSVIEMMLHTLYFCKRFNEKYKHVKHWVEYPSW